MHGAEPWTELAVKLMLKWPGLHYMTSAFAPKHYPKAIINYANTRGADKIMYCGYFPAGLSLERQFTDMPNVPFKDEVWPKFLRENALRVFKINEHIGGGVRVLTSAKKVGRTWADGSRGACSRPAGCRCSASSSRFW